MQHNRHAAQRLYRMSLRGSVVTEAISCLSDNKEIAALPAGARNDKKVITTPSLRTLIT
jgi:hypothetical protein